MKGTPLYMTGITPDGSPLIGGIYTLKDQSGFPLDMSYEEVRRMGACPDWAECLADAGAQCIIKFDGVVTELSCLLGEAHAAEIVSKFKQWGAALAAEVGMDWAAVCQRMLVIKRTR